MAKDQSAQQYGHEFQGRIQSLISKAQAKHPLRLIRLYDSRSAGVSGNKLPEQDGDFIVQAAGIGWLIEVKTSSTYSSLGENRSSLTSLMKDVQAAGQRLWHRAGGRGLVVFHAKGSSKVEFWNGLHVAECYVKPRENLDFSKVVEVPATDQQLSAALVRCLVDPDQFFKGSTLC